MLKVAGDDERFMRLWKRSAEYARAYIMARERQKGCDGLGSMTMMKAEFKEALDGLLAYCATKDYISRIEDYDLDRAAAAFRKAEPPF